MHFGVVKVGLLWLARPEVFCQRIIFKKKVRWKIKYPPTLTTPNTYKNLSLRAGLNRGIFGYYAPNCHICGSYFFLLWLKLAMHRLCDCTGRISHYEVCMITWLEMGWPGSVEDNQVWSVMFTCQRKNISTTSSICLVIWHFLHPQL